MFKIVKRKIITGEICHITEETKQRLIDDHIVHVDISYTGEEESPYAYVIDQCLERQKIWLGCYIAKEPGGKGYYRIDADTAEKIFILEDIEGPDKE